MSRPVGSKNSKPSAQRKMVGLRLSSEELATMKDHAERLGLEFGSWARMVLRKAVGLAENKPVQEKEQDENKNV